MNGFRKMVWKSVWLRLSPDTLEINKAQETPLVLSRVHMAGIESCGLLVDMDGGFRVACLGGVVMQLRCTNGASRSAHNWVRAICRNAKEASMCDAPYDARAAWDVVERS